MVSNFDSTIIIVGAGISGLYAAYLLKKKGFKNKNYRSLAEIVRAYLYLHRF